MIGIGTRAILVAVDITDLREGQLPVDQSVKELELLAETAGAIVVNTIVQKREKPHPAFYAGRGLINSLAAMVKDEEADLIVFDDELSGSQIRNIENITGTAVIDRTALILDIFAKRAKTKEGKLQVELAQLDYRLPRLSGFGEHLSRLAGGIGTRGPGETKLETDRRHIRRRMNQIKKQLEEVRRNRQVQRKSRDSITQIALVGYTNAGKSTLRLKLLQQYPGSNFNKKLLNSEENGSDQLFATLDTTFRSIKLPSGREAVVGDTVGFIQKLPHQLVSAFKSTLEEILKADLILHVVDAASEYYQYQAKAVKGVLEEIGACKLPIITVYNKIDKLPEKDHILFPVGEKPVVEVSALTGEGLNKLAKAIDEKLGEEMFNYTLYLPYSKSNLLATIYKNAIVRNIKYEMNNIAINLEISSQQKHMLEQFM